MYTYTQLQELKTRIIQQLANEQNKLTASKAAFTASKDTLTSMQSLYGDWATQVNAYQAANRDNPAAEALKAERDILVSEFASTRTEAVALETAVTEI